MLDEARAERAVPAMDDALADQTKLDEAPLSEAPLSDAAAEEPYADYDDSRGGRRAWIEGFGACFVSMMLHICGMLLLAITVVPQQVRDSVQDIISQAVNREDQELQEIELSQDIEAATEVTDAVFSSQPVFGNLGSAPSAAPSAPRLDSRLLEQFDAPRVRLDSPFISMPSTKSLISAIPEGALGDPRAIVDDYQQAFDRITHELLWMLDKGDLLVIWGFDQSESMKDDQREIRQRIDRVYAELGLTAGTKSERLATAVTSYGARFAVHTERPTSELGQIQEAIDQVPIDPSGREIMSEAMIRAIGLHRDYARKTKRQMALILVTDESGERPNNDMFLERAIAEAKAADCRIYTLGREAVFGYPYAHLRWRHPQTKRHHWLPMDRGPETAFVEMLQTNGFRRRHDAFGSGFAPYEQARIARETGGVFFMLPSLETNIVRGEKRRFELDRLKAYKPDLRPRLELFAERDKHPLRTFIWQVVSDLNPHNQQAARVVELREWFTKNTEQLVSQVRQEQTKAKVHLRYLAEAQKILEEAQVHREQEADPRWQANYDLIYAQIVAFQARVHEYGAYLDEFLEQQRDVPRTKSPNLELDHWSLVTRAKIRTEESKPYVEKSTELFKQVIANHEGTPWAARAQWELNRGFGVKLNPIYYPPLPNIKNPIKPPKL